MAIISETSENIRTETGGIFLGCFENGSWYVIEAIDPGPKSVFQAAYFEYDRKYTEHLINKIARMYKANLTLIGLWHRHPGSFDEFSSTDDGTNSDYAKLSPNGAISILVNIDPKFRLTPYHVAWPLRYTRITYKVGDNLIPAHLVQLKEAEKSLTYINGYADKSHIKSPSEKSKADFVRLLDRIRGRFQPVEMTKDDYITEESEKHRDTLIDSLLDDITYFSETCRLALKVEQNKDSICLSHRGVDSTITKVFFSYSVPKEQIIFSYGDTSYLYEPSLFSELLADNSKAEISFKSGLMHALGIEKENPEEEV